MSAKFNLMIKKIIYQNDKKKKFNFFMVIKFEKFILNDVKYLYLCILLLLLFVHSFIVIVCAFFLECNKQ